MNYKYFSVKNYSVCNWLASLPQGAFPYTKVLPSLDSCLICKLENEAKVFTCDKRTSLLRLDNITAQRTLYSTDLQVSSSKF
jgi:hypothetical protein